MISKSTYKYDNIGNCVENYSDNRDVSSLSLRYVSKYDFKGILIEQNEKASYYGFPNIKIKYTHDNKGNLIAKDSFFRETNEILGKCNYDESYEYEFDKADNWVQQKKFLNALEKGYKEQVDCKKREIEYY